MRKATIKKNGEALLALARQLAAMPNMTWVDANNIIYAHGGPVARLFPTKTDRIAYFKTPESKQIDELIDSLPEPQVRGPLQYYDNKFMIPIDKPTNRKGRKPRRNKKAMA